MWERFTQIKKIIAGFFRVQNLTRADLDLLKANRFFEILDDEKFQKLLQNTQVVEYPANHLIFKEGEKANAFYIISHGSVRLFTYDKLGKKIVLARLDGGAHFGEQAIHGQTTKTRMASVESTDPIRLLVVSAKFFKEILRENVSIRSDLVRQGNVQLVNKVVKSVPTLEMIEPYLKKKANDVVSYLGGDIIFRVNDPSDCVYIILLGVIEVEITNNGLPSIIKLTPGDLFGELGVLQNAARAGTARAVEFTRMVRIPSEEFKRYVEENLEFKELLTILGNTYKIKNHGYVTQYFGKLKNLNSITTEYKLSNSRFVSATHSVTNQFLMVADKKEEKDFEVYHYTRSNLKIELHVANNYITSVKATEYWRYLDNVCTYILERRPVTAQQLKAFQEKGTFRLDDVKGEMICPCLFIEKDTVLDLIDNGVNTFSQIAKDTGASTVCGICRPRIQNLLGEKSWIAAEIKLITLHNTYIGSYLIQLQTGKLNFYTPGEHVIVQAKIGSNWIKRSFAIADVQEDNKIRITVKLKKSGLMSDWFRVNEDRPMPIYVSKPMGNFKLQINDMAPIICFAGGIGVAPFLAFAKALKNQNSKRAMQLIYVAGTANDFIFQDEFHEISKEMPNFQLILWNRSEAGHLSDGDILKITKEHTDPLLYVCGREDFEAEIVKSLVRLKYPETKIFVERFTYAAEKSQLVDD